MSFIDAAKDLGAWDGNGQAANSPEVIAARQRWEREQAETAKERDEEEAKLQAKAAEKSLRIFQTAKPAPLDHPYLRRRASSPPTRCARSH